MHDQPTQRSHRLLVVDDHPMMRCGLIHLLSQEPDLSVCGEYDNFESALAGITTCQPTLVLMGLSLLTGQGLEFIHAVQKHDPQMLILVLSDRDEILYAIRALQAGAQGYLSKRVDLPTLRTAIRKVLDGGIAVNEELASRLVKAAITGRPIEEGLPMAQLTNRELEVLNYIGEGYSIREIAATLCLSAKTIETYHSNLIKKLQLSHARDLIRYAIQWVLHLGNHACDRAHMTQ